MSKRGAKTVSANEYRRLRDGNAAILFYKEACGYCRRFKPTWNEVAKRIARDDGDLGLSVVKVNVKKYPFVTREESIGTVPHMKLYKEGKDPVEYTGSRESDDVYQALVNYYRNDVAPPKQKKATTMDLTLFAQILRQALMEKEERASKAPISRALK